jgi:hypothetical protein
LHTRGGPLVINHQEIRRKEEMAVKNPLNYLAGFVYRDPEKMSGHHAAFTLLIGDEASGLDDEVWKRGRGWAKHMLFFGNAEFCNNEFKKSIKAGDLRAT